MKNPEAIKIYDHMPQVDLEEYLDNRRATNVSFIGMSGSGKTYGAIAFIKQLPRPVLILQDGTDAQFDDFEQVPNVPKFLEWLKHGKTNVVVATAYTKEIAEIWFKAASAVSPVTLYVDEAGLYVREKLPTSLAAMLFQGRRIGQHVIWSTQRPQLVHADLRSGTQYIFAFSMQDELSIKAATYVRKYDETIYNLPPEYFIQVKGGNKLFLQKG